MDRVVLGFKPKFEDEIIPASGRVIHGVDAPSRGRQLHGRIAVFARKIEPSHRSELETVIENFKDYNKVVFFFPIESIVEIDSMLQNILGRQLSQVDKAELPEEFEYARSLFADEYLTRLSQEFGVDDFELGLFRLEAIDTEVDPKTRVGPPAERMKEDVVPEPTLDPVLQKRLEHYLDDRFHAEIIFMARVLEEDKDISSIEDRIETLESWVSLSLGYSVQDRRGKYPGIIDPQTYKTTSPARSQIDEHLQKAYGASAKSLLSRFKPAFGSQGDRRRHFVNPVGEKLEYYLVELGGMKKLPSGDGFGSTDHVFYSDDWFTVAYVFERAKATTRQHADHLGAQLYRAEVHPALAGKRRHGAFFAASISPLVEQELTTLNSVCIGIRIWTYLENWLDRYAKAKAIDQVVPHLEGLLSGAGLLDVVFETSLIDGAVS